MRLLIVFSYFFLSFLPVADAHHNSFIDDQYQFAAIGDYGSNQKGEMAVAKIVHEYEPSFIITLGDNNYPNGCWKTIDDNIGQYYHDYIYPYVGKYGPGAEYNRFFPALGNHDWNARKKCLKNGTLPYLIYFSLPNNQRYYVIHKPNIDFFVLDSDSHEPDGNTIDSAQYTWFVREISKSQATFKIVYFHEPPYSSGKHGPTKAIRWPFKALGVDMVLSGHEHNYERLKKAGLPYVVNGLGGPPSIRGKSWHPDPDSIKFYNKDYGFLLFDVSQHKLTMRFINTKDQTVDNLTITK